MRNYRPRKSDIDYIIQYIQISYNDYDTILYTGFQNLHLTALNHSEPIIYDRHTISKNLTWLEVLSQMATVQKNSLKHILKRFRDFLLCRKKDMNCVLFIG